MYSFPNLEPVHCFISGSNFWFLACIQVPQEAGKVVCFSHLFKNFPQFVVIHTVKGFSLVTEAEVDVFLEFSCFFYALMGVGNLISDFSAFSKSSLNIWKFMVHVLLKPSLENSEHHFANMWDECSCVVVWTFFGIAFLWNWNENWPFLVLSQEESPTLPYAGTYFQNQICSKIFIGGNMFWTRVAIVGRREWWVRYLEF